jgi:hypothetical protein
MWHRRCTKNGCSDGVGNYVHFSAKLFLAQVLFLIQWTANEHVHPTLPNQHATEALMVTWDSKGWRENNYLLHVNPFHPLCGRIFRYIFHFFKDKGSIMLFHDHNTVPVLWLKRFLASNKNRRKASINIPKCVKTLLSQRLYNFLGPYKLHLIDDKKIRVRLRICSTKC